MRKTIILISLLAVVAAGFLSYKYWFQKDHLNLWSLVPESAVLVYENERLMQTWAELQETPTWQNIAQIKPINRLAGSLEFLDSLMGGNGRLEQITEANPVLISLHITSKDDFDFLYQLEVQNIESHASVWQAIDNFNSLGYSTSKRIYQDHSLTEIRKDGDVFTYIFYENFFIGSFTPFLVEDVIRTLDDPELGSFASSHIELFSLAKLQNDAGNIYINSNKLGNLVSLFIDDLKVQPDILDQFALSTFLDISMNENSALLNGFTLAGNDSKSFLSTFHENPGSTFDLAKFIPLNAAALYHFTFENAVKWNENFNRNREALSNDKIDPRSKIRDDYDIDLNQYFSWIDSEIGLALMESADVQNPDKLAFIEVNDPTEALKDLNRLAQMSSIQSDSLYSENYDDIEITQIHIPELPSALFGPTFNDFEDSFFLLIDQFIVISDNVQAIKKWYDQFQNDNTWGKSVRINQFLDTSLKEANFSLFVNTNRSWQILKHYLAPDWQRFTEENSGVFRRFEMTAFQFSYIDNKYYSSITIHQPEGQLVSSSRYDEIENIEFMVPIATKPFIVRSHLDRNLEVLFQDSLNTLYKLNSKGKVAWTKTLSGRIISGVHQVDFFKNRKLQYLFVTSDQLHVMDINGDYVSPYPMKLPKGVEAEYLSLVDYDKSKNYRFMVADKSGSIYLFDKSGKNLSGWTPRKLNGPLAFPAFHQRVRNRDRMIAVQRNGVVNILTRTGLVAKGFPIDLKADTNSKPFIQVGSSFANTKITTITTDGDLVEFNLEGQILNRNQLYKPDPQTTFSTLPDALGQSLLLIRQTDNRLAILDQSGQVLFEKDYLSEANLEWQYYDFGGTKEVIIILDKDQQFAYLYNQTGQLINFQPVESSHQIALLYFANDNQFQLHKTFENQYSLIEFSF